MLLSELIKHSIQRHAGQQKTLTLIPHACTYFISRLELDTTRTYSQTRAANTFKMLLTSDELEIISRTKISLFE